MEKPAPPQAAQKDAVVDAADGGGFWQDLRDACPFGLPPMAIVLKVISLASSIIVYLALPSMRVENGSVDACDPVRTYGEIPQEGMLQLMDAVGRDVGASGDFLDIGSGFGNYAIWACRHGGFSRCWGVELMQDRHEVAEATLRDAGVAGVTLLLGDMKHHPQVYRNLSFAYWNNLCFPEDVSKAVTAQFAASAPVGAELWALAALPGPLAPGIARAHSDVFLMMPWRPEFAYRTFRYRRVANEDVTG